MPAYELVNLGFPSPSPEDILEIVENGSNIYLAAGATSTQDGATLPMVLDALRFAHQSGALILLGGPAPGSFPRPAPGGKDRSLQQRLCPGYAFFLPQRPHRDSHRSAAVDLVCGESDHLRFLMGFVNFMWVGFG